MRHLGKEKERRKKVKPSAVSPLTGLRANRLVTHTHTHTQSFYSSLVLVRATWVSWYQKLHFAIFWIFWCKMKAAAPTIRMDCHPIQTNWCPTSAIPSPHHFCTGCPFWHNPPNLSWLGTGTKYAGLHTRWLGFAYSPS